MKTLLQPAASRLATVLLPLAVNLDTADMVQLTHLLKQTDGPQPSLLIECGNLDRLRTRGICAVVSQLLVLRQTGALICLRSVGPVLHRALRLLGLDSLFYLAG